MEAVEIVEGLNQYVEEKFGNNSGYFIVHKTIEINPTVKAYKTYSTEVWYVNHKSKQKLSVIKVNATSKVTTDAEEARVISKMNTLLSYHIVGFIYEGGLKEVIEYGEHSSKQISD